jgi:hypothetical protein
MLSNESRVWIDGHVRTASKRLLPAITIVAGTIAASLGVYGGPPAQAQATLPTTTSTATSTSAAPPAGAIAPANVAEQCPAAALVDPLFPRSGDPLAAYPDLREVVDKLRRYTFQERGTFGRVDVDKADRKTLYITFTAGLNRHAAEVAKIVGPTQPFVVCRSSQVSEPFGLVLEAKDLLAALNVGQNYEFICGPGDVYTAPADPKIVIVSLHSSRREAAEILLSRYENTVQIMLGNFPYPDPLRNS